MLKMSIRSCAKATMKTNKIRGSNTLKIVIRFSFLKYIFIPVYNLNAVGMPLFSGTQKTSDF